METVVAAPTTTLSTILTGSASLEIARTIELRSTLGGTANYQITPFVFDTQCINSWIWAETDIPASASAILLKPKGVHSFCMPDSMFWDETFNFYPGVCPEGWVMYDIGRANKSRQKDGSVDTQTTAYCCPRGYQVTHGALLGMTLTTDRACYASFSTNGTPANITVVKMPGLSTRTFKFGDVLQPAWHIIWDATDQADLQPPPPTLGSTVGDVIATWTPPYVVPLPRTMGITRTATPSGLTTGSTTHSYSTPTPTKDDYNVCSTSSCGLSDGIIFVMIGLPTIVGLLLISSCVYYCRRNRKAKRAGALGRAKVYDGKIEEYLELPMRNTETAIVNETPPAYAPTASTPATRE